MATCSTKKRQNKLYKQYLRNPDITTPKTTVWRYKRSKINPPVMETTGTLNNGVKRQRRLYNTTASATIPRQTKWNWKKKHDAPSVCSNREEENAAENSATSDVELLTVHCTRSMVHVQFYFK
uniref:Uncharacterized protein n=1 Tax=Amphimedon queenslandica TaxID=400682 RepID=A0A1X7URI2_AMPQE